MIYFDNILSGSWLSAQKRFSQNIYKYFKNNGMSVILHNKVCQKNITKEKNSTIFQTLIA